MIRTVSERCASPPRRKLWHFRNQIGNRSPLRHPRHCPFHWGSTCDGRVTRSEKDYVAGDALGKAEDEFTRQVAKFAKRIDGQVKQGSSSFLKKRTKKLLRRPSFTSAALNQGTPSPPARRPRTHAIVISSPTPTPLI